MSADITLSVTHATTYRYASPVETAQHLATIRPLDRPWQRVVSHRLSIDPAPSYETSHGDAFGNEVCYFSFDAPHDSLQLTSQTTVVLTPRWIGLDPFATRKWDDVAAELRYRAGGAYRPESEFVFASPNIALAPELRAYAAGSFPEGRPLLSGVRDLTHRIYEDFEYDPDASTRCRPS